MAENNTRTRKDIKEDELLIKNKEDLIVKFGLIAEKTYSQMSGDMEYKNFLKINQHANYMVRSLQEEIKIMYKMIENTKVKIKLDDYLDKKCVKEKHINPLSKRFKGA